MGKSVIACAQYLSAPPQSYSAAEKDPHYRLVVGGVITEQHKHQRKSINAWEPICVLVLHKYESGKRSLTCWGFTNSKPALIIRNDTVHALLAVYFIHIILLHYLFLLHIRFNWYVDLFDIISLIVAAMGLPSQRVPEKEAHRKRSLLHCGNQDCFGPRVWHGLPGERYTTTSEIITRQYSHVKVVFTLFQLRFFFFWKEHNEKKKKSVVGRDGYLYQCLHQKILLHVIADNSGFTCCCIMGWFFTHTFCILAFK